MSKRLIILAAALTILSGCATSESTPPRPTNVPSYEDWKTWPPIGPSFDQWQVKHPNGTWGEFAKRYPCNPMPCPGGNG